VRTELKTQEWYLADPRTKKWIVQCATCKTYGRKSNTPEVPKVNFEKNFPVLELDEDSLCPVCHELEHKA
jgi:hypothetical protein